MLKILLSIALVLIIATVLIIAIRKGYIAQIKTGLLYLVSKAEQLYGGGTGELKYSAVSEWVYQKIPPYLKPFITVKLIGSLIEDAVLQMKAYLTINESANKLITSVAAVENT